MTDLTRSYAEANRELVESFVRYMVARGFSAQTQRSYGKTLAQFAEGFGAVSMVEARRPDIHNFLGALLSRGIAENTVRRETAALRCFFKFLRLGDLIQRDPMLQVGHRKLPKRLPRVLSVEEVERVINAAQTPVERAVAEVLYATGVRVSELCAIKLENIIFPEHMILIERGKGGKDRWVLYGRHAALAIAKYQEWRPSQAGYLFESPDRTGSLHVVAKHWQMSFYVRNGRQHAINLGKVADLPTEEAARAAWQRIRANIPDCRYMPSEGKSQGPYTARGIAGVLARLAHRARVESVHPHSFRRAMACHMLAHGADMRAIQELLGHKNLTTTQIYTTLTNEKIDEIYRKAHPHARSIRGTDAAEKD